MTGISDGVGQLELFDFCYQDAEFISPPKDVFPHSICSTPTENSTHVEPLTKCYEAKGGTPLEVVLCRLSPMSFPGKDYIRKSLHREAIKML